MNILITGAAGFIGSNLGELLIADNKITGIDNFDPFYGRNIKENNLKNLRNNPNFTFYEADILNSGALDSTFAGRSIDAIIHIAAKAGVRPSIANPAEYAMVNYNGTVNMLEMAKRYEIQTFIFASSSSVYGNNRKVPFSETDPVDNPISPYAASKKAAELICHSYAKLNDMKIACLRFFTVYGPRQRPDLAIAKFTKLIGMGEEIPFYGDGSSQRDYTFIDDITSGVAGCLNWLESQPDSTYEIFNLGNNNRVSLRRLVELIENGLGKKAIIRQMPMQPGDVNVTYANISKAHRTFGYGPKTLIEDGIPKYIEYYKGISEE